MESKEQVAQEINQQILHLMSSKSVTSLFQEKKISSERLKILSEMEVLDEGFLIINKK